MSPLLGWLLVLVPSLGGPLTIILEVFLYGLHCEGEMFGCY